MLFKAELFKLKRLWTPRVIMIIWLGAELLAAVIVTIAAPRSGNDYLDVETGVWLGVGFLLAVVFGGWLMGSEYRQATVTRSLSTNANRSGLMTAKGLTGLAALLIGSAISFGTAIMLCWISTSIHSKSFATTDLGKVFLAGILGMGLAALFAYCLSIVLKSDTFGILSALGVFMILDPLLGAIPKVGGFFPGSCLNQINNVLLDGESLGRISTQSAIATLCVWVIAIALVSNWVFSRRDL